MLSLTRMSIEEFQSETYTLISETNSMKSECTGLIVKDLNARPIKMVLLSQGLSLISLWGLGKFICFSVSPWYKGKQSLLSQLTNGCDI